MTKLVDLLRQNCGGRAAKIERERLAFQPGALAFHDAGYPLENELYRRLGNAE